MGALAGGKGAVTLPGGKGCWANNEIFCPIGQAMKSPLKKKITNPKNFFLLSFTFQLPGENSSLRLTCGRGNAGPRETSARLPGPIYGYEIQGFFMISFIAKQGADVKAK